MKHTYLNIIDSKFNKIIFQLTGYLCRQYSLISDMQARYLKATKTHWMVMGIACNWLILNQAWQRAEPHRAGALLGEGKLSEARLGKLGPN